MMIKSSYQGHKSMFLKSLENKQSLLLWDTDWLTSDQLKWAAQMGQTELFLTKPNAHCRYLIFPHLSAVN